MNDIYDVLETCLQSLENGADMETLLSKYPDMADELRPLLEASLRARSMAEHAAPSAAGMRRGRARLLQRAAEMREARAPQRRRQPVIPIFQRIAITLGITSALLLSGTGLVSASSSALPGENLYPVKRTWEDIRLLFVFNPNLREALRSEYEQERLHEVNELLAEGRHETIQFAGVYTKLASGDYVSGIRVIFTSDTKVTPDLVDGAAVVVTGRTNADGFVELFTVDLLPLGSPVPIGLPVEVESQGGNLPAPQPGSQTESEPSSGHEAAISPASGEKQDEFRIEGIVESFDGTILKLNGQILYSDQARVEGIVKPGSKVKAEGYYTSDGRFIVTKIKVDEEGSGKNKEKENSGSDANKQESGSGGSDGGGDDHEEQHD
jgi:hypothetical protein